MQLSKRLIVLAVPLILILVVFCRTTKDESVFIQSNVVTGGLANNQSGEIAYSSGDTQAADNTTNKPTDSLYDDVGESDVTSRIAKKAYDENWCDAAHELSGEDYQRFKLEAKEWARQRGAVNIALNGYSPFEALNNEFVAPYQEMDVEDLLALGRQDDKLALSTLIQRSDVERELKTKLARYLAILGETSKSLSYLVLDEFHAARFEFEQKLQVNEKVRQHLLNSIAYAEIGLERKDPAAFQSWLYIINQPENSLKPDAILKNEELNQVKAIKQRIRLHIQKKREEKNLLTISSIEIPRVAERLMMHEIAIVLASMDQDPNSSRIVSHWADEYFQDQDCLNSLMARY